MSIKKIKFIGYSGSGKTTLIENVVKKLTNENYNVATIKHDVHGLDIDREGKDSYRFSNAGAKISVVSSPELVVYKCHKKLTLDEIIENIKGVDLVIIEGYSADDGCRCINVARKETNKGFKEQHNSNCIAYVSDYTDEELNEMGYDSKFFNINDIDGVVEFIKNLA